VQLPPAIASLVGDGQLNPVDVGCTSASVFRIDRPGRPTIFLKCALVARQEGLADEAGRLRWLHGRLAVPRVLAFLVHRDREYLVTSGLAGVNGVVAGMRNPEAVVTGMAGALARLHAQPARGCPFDETLQVRIERARARLEQGLVDEADFDDERHGMTAAQVWRELETHPALSESPVLTHGDACLPNVIFDGDAVAGFVDCGRAGAADAYQDLALAAHSIAGNLGPAWVVPFFEAYGLSLPDDRKLRLYRLLDEFF